MSGSTATLNDYYRPTTTENREWTCPRCTMVNTSNFLNCAACLEGKNPHHQKGTTNELVIEQTKRHQESTQNVERSLTDKVKTFVGGWTCRVCGTNTRFGNFCSACDYALDPVKQTTKQIPNRSSKSQKNNTSVIGSIRGISNFRTNSIQSRQESSVDKSKFVLVTKDSKGITDETVSPTSLFQNKESFPKSNPSPAPSLDSGHCTMSDTTSQIDQPSSEAKEECSSPIACSEAATDNTWTCPDCKAVNRAVVDQNKCYVCNIGTGPRNIVPLLPSQDKPHNGLEVTSNQSRLHNPPVNQVSMHQNDLEKTPSPKIAHRELVQRDGPTIKTSDTPRPRPMKLTYNHAMEVNNNPTQFQRRSFGDECTPSPAKNCTKMMTCQLREETSEADRQYKTIRERCIKTKEPFVDPEFLPNDTSLYVDDRSNDPDPGDIAQGVLGNCRVTTTPVWRCSVCKVSNRGMHKCYVCNLGICPQQMNDEKLQNQTKTTSPKQVKIYKKQQLGGGAYGCVYKAKCNDVVCAAKIIHPTLANPCTVQVTLRKRQHRHPRRRFEQECDFLKEIEHPNIVEFLGITTDPETKLPVLLMELMDESLASFLEKSSKSIAYCTQLSLAFDVIKAIAFLHFKHIVHRDLSSNNILIRGNGEKAKLTDFGMAKLVDVRLSGASNTLCPGAPVYMPPEAIDNQSSYSDKGDVFSFGVNVLQILTTKYPDPTDRFVTLSINHPQLPSGVSRVCIQEVIRRKTHIDEVEPRHLLLPIVLDCLKDLENDRPTSVDLYHRIAELTA